ncbi:hypothetical protein ATY41_10235 [Leifsonia xyli subsp. xyli]|uniref:Exosortase/archaeosortase family protein n=2 Tax=Leifsonia xyli subsp. xyli TaxID=59736 RepID=Q6AH93_LEIXX|nr:exosortase/archaeosortase family protein [Leifsonia xyli]AAT88252.1 hypothetical protein Lxx01940 [Leifsonia xyli subsp. xyli str. CTCB07]ODA90355.1 hypothetical protein ATY41_10235 [Leifsonia xyli subsp. xyli]
MSAVESRVGATPVSTTNRWMPALRVLSAVVCLELVGVLLLTQEKFRAYEATLVSAVGNFFEGRISSHMGDAVLVQTSDLVWTAFRITMECTSLVMIIPLLLFSALIVLPAKAHWGSWLTATVVGLVLIEIINVARIWLIILATRTWSEAGFWWTHVVSGSVLAIFGASVTVTVMLKIVNGKIRNRAERTPSA